MKPTDLVHRKGLDETEQKVSFLRAAAAVSRFDPQSRANRAARWLFLAAPRRRAGL